ncbi:MAG: ATP synthase subunit I [Caldilineaceae bacterium]|nr:ATP synthase subunit I [Caldilineaceae bacterium]
MLNPMEVDGMAMGIALVGGLGLGFFYYGGLWWTVRQLSSAQRPEWLFLASFVGRTLLAVAGLAIVTGADWARLLVSLAGFWLARVYLTRRLAPE